MSTREPKAARTLAEVGGAQSNSRPCPSPAAGQPSTAPLRGGGPPPSPAPPRPRARADQDGPSWAQGDGRAGRRVQGRGPGGSTRQLLPALSTVLLKEWGKKTVEKNTKILEQSYLKQPLTLFFIFHVLGIAARYSQC